MCGKLRILFMAAASLTISHWALAHHSASIYDRDHILTLTGTVTKFAFTNPHVEIFFEVIDAQGNKQQWIAESGSPNRLYRSGWTSKSLKPGDRITVTGAPMKNGRKLLTIKKLEGVTVPTLRIGAE